MNDIEDVCNGQHDFRISTFTGNEVCWKCHRSPMAVSIDVISRRVEGLAAELSAFGEILDKLNFAFEELTDVFENIKER